MSAQHPDTQDGPQQLPHGDARRGQCHQHGSEGEELEPLQPRGQRPGCRDMRVAALRDRSVPETLKQALREEKGSVSSEGEGWQARRPPQHGPPPHRSAHLGAQGRERPTAACPSTATGLHGRAGTDMVTRPGIAGGAPAGLPGTGQRAVLHRGAARCLEGTSGTGPGTPRSLHPTLCQESQAPRSRCDPVPGSPAQGRGQACSLHVRPEPPLAPTLPSKSPSDKRFPSDKLFQLKKAGLQKRPQKCKSSLQRKTPKPGGTPGRGASNYVPSGMINSPPAPCRTQVFTQKPSSSKITAHPTIKPGRTAPHPFFPSGFQTGTFVTSRRRGRGPPRRPCRASQACTLSRVGRGRSACPPHAHTASGARTTLR